ncbi:MAG TPA: hypothetical protein VGN13_05575 [Solirubrobacteraceae bacterium]|jgi:hypothetical protein
MRALLEHTFATTLGGESECAASDGVWVVLAEKEREVQEIVGPFASEAEAHDYARSTSVPGVWICKPTLMRASWLDSDPKIPDA